MTSVERNLLCDHAGPAGQAGWRGTLRRLAVDVRNAYILAALTAAALPWSTSATAILIVLWLIVLIPTLDWGPFARHLAHPACALPLAFVALAVLGVLWTDGTWSESLSGIKPAAKLLVIPFLLFHFQRSQRAMWVFAAFLGSCTLMMVLSWIVLFYPAFKITRTVSDGVPVKNYIDQSQEFALCAFALALPALIAIRERRLAVAIGWLVLSLAFVANMMFVASARTALVYMPVLLVLFTALHLSRRTMPALFAAAIVAAAIVWSTSPYLRQRIADIATEYQGYETNTVVSTAQRLHYWRKSLGFFADAPLFGHGTGSTRQLFARAAGQTGLSAEVVSNPHNQTLNVAVQWGLLGVITLYGMWLSHLLLFRGEGLAAWIGLITVVQNFVSSLLNSHLFDFHEGWMYVLGVGVAGGMSLRATIWGPRSSEITASRNAA
ncbi:O-antigen ligase family protein [Bradyrhizobium sp. AUGA SZCCT0222]|uniref:O-antigen ligase family protein n=1 Tax=Bradyrhizobium sp. AUGA SZCCT0222 TaxID=2807668 RepID=UPI001BA45E87|nr:O-antigen ligase family protein [Bradyrhizobium sp. AUGA SZCCT0222]MBR1269749.1 O-antigen ligase family protein [Bradyrhizobium sp. AUGA SZCCT0222]